MKAPKPQDNPKKKADVKPTSMTTNSGVAKANAEDKDRVIRYYENPDYLIKNKIGRTGYWNEFQKFLQDYTLPSGEKFIQNEQVNKGTSNEFSDKALQDYRASLVKKFGEGHPNVDRLAITPEDVKQVQTYYNQGDSNFKVDARIGGETSQLRYPTLTKADVKVAEGNYAPVMYGKKQYLAPADKYNSGNFTNDLIPYNPSFDAKIDPSALKALGTYTTQSTNQPTLPIEQNKAKGGLVQKLVGGGKVRGDKNGDGFVSAKEQENLNNQDKAKSTIGGALGGVGTAYYNSKEPTSEGDSVRSSGLAAASNMGVIGGVIGGVAAIGDKIGAKPKANAEQIDASTGELKNEGRTKSMAGLGIALSPSKRLTYEGGLTDVSGQAYIKSIEDKTKAQLNAVNVANRNAKMQQLIEARNNQEENPMIQNMYDTNGATFDANHNLVLANGQQFDPNRPQYKKGGVVGKVKQMCSEGGEIKGEGGPKDDKIEAKVKEGSFVVPAENAELAKGIRKLYLKAPIKKANLNQKGGEEVMLSNKEHLFTPEENEYLESVGIDLEDLAPNAEEGNKKAGGGDVVDPAKELAKIEAEKKNIEAIKAKREADRTAAKKAALQRSIIEARKSDRQSKIKSWEKKYNDSKTKLDALNKAYEDMVKEFDEMGNATKKDRAIGVAGTKDGAYQRKSKEKLLKEIQEADKEFKNAKQTYDYVKDDNNYNATGESKISEAKRTGLKAPVVPKSVKKEDVATTPKAEVVTPKVKSTTTTKKQLSAPKTEPFMVNANPDEEVVVPGDKLSPIMVNANPDEEVVVPGDKLSPNERAIANADAEKATVQASALNKSLPQTVATNGTPQNQRRGLADVIGNINPTALVGIGQTALGLNSLRGQVRPVDKAVIDPTYNASVNRSIEDAKFGLTPEQKFLATQDIQNSLNDAKAIGLNYAGGNGAQAFNTNRAAINDAWKNKLGLKQADTEARMAKQKYADAMAADRANILSANRRQAFNDAMYTFQQKQQAGSELIGAGLQNIIGAYRFNKELQRSKNVNDASNPYKNV